MNSPRPWLLAGAWLSVAASALHLACIVGGPDWYRFFGAGEGMARAAERGDLLPTVITLIIAAILAGWAVYAFSAAGIVRRLPLVRTVLVAIAAVLLLRSGMVAVPSVWAPEKTMAFRIWSSLACFVLGACFAIGLLLAWPNLSKKESR